MAGFLNEHNGGSRQLRELLAGQETILAPGAYDALSARLIEAAGFPVVYMTGFGVAASMLGRPDVGLATMTEMVDSARRITQSVRVPVIADADTGYGNALNVVRTVREYEAAGVAGIQLEDQVAPKRCGHMTGRQLIDTDEMEGKIRAARRGTPVARSPHHCAHRCPRSRGDRPRDRARQALLPRRRRHAVR